MSVLNMTDVKWFFKNNGSGKIFIKFHGSCKSFYYSTWLAISIFHKALLESQLFARLRVWGKALEKTCFAEFNSDFMGITVCCLSISLLLPG